MPGRIWKRSSNSHSDNLKFRIENIENRKLYGLAVGAMFLALSFPAQAQQPKKIPRIGVLIGGPAAARLYDEVFRQGLRELGYVEGQNVVLELRDAEAKAERLPDLAAELVRLKVDVIVTSSTPAIQAAKQATGTTQLLWRSVEILWGPGSWPA